MNQLVRWWITFTIMLIIIGTALFAGLAQLIVGGDRTFISWVVLAMFLGVSIHLGYKVYKNPQDIDYGVPDRGAEFCTALGLLGTIIGLTIALTGAFAEVDVSNHESLKSALVNISTGVSTALLTTLTGLVASLGIQFQTCVLKEKWGA